jgi:hypothetical protein
MRQPCRLRHIMRDQYAGDALVAANLRDQSLYTML